MACEEYQDQIYFLQRGELEPGAAAAVRQHVETCARCRAAYDAEETLTLSLGRAAQYAAPAALRERVAAALRAGATEGNLRRWGAQLWRPLATAAAGAAAAVLIAVPLTWWLAGRPPAPIVVLVRQAAAEQERVERTRVWEHSLQAPQEALAYLTTWLEIAFPKPPMARAELTLIGAKPTYFFGRRAAAFVYEDPAGRLITLLVFPGGDVQVPERGRVQVDKFRPYFSAADGFTLCVWKQGDVGFSMVGKMSQEELARAFLKIRESF